jgi:hypothetical protein
MARSRSVFYLFRLAYTALLRQGTFGLHQRLPCEAKRIEVPKFAKLVPGERLRGPLVFVLRQGISRIMLILRLLGLAFQGSPLLRG